MFAGLDASKAGKGQIKIQNAPAVHSGLWILHGTEPTGKSDRIEKKWLESTI